MITANVISRTFHLKFADSTATCFTIDLDNKQYFITAKHVINSLRTGSEIELYYNGRWEKLPVSLIGHSSNSDVSVFALDFALPAHPLPAIMDGMAYGQDVYFLGFPYGLKSEMGHLNRDFPMPLVKKGIVSAMFFNNANEGKFFYIDGHNNPGFSGGPVVFSQLGNHRLEYKVGGIISGYRYDLENAVVGGQKLDIQYKTNTGIIIAYSIENAIEIIKKNPAGVTIPQIVL